MTSPMFRELRLAEIRDSIGLLHKYQRGGDLLEIGAGTGWQAKALSAAGFRVEAVDLPVTNALSGHARARAWPIRDYDGAHLPYSDGAFDVIYSSNVLEHVIELDTLNDEMKRVLRPGGVALHLVPNSAWRLLSLFTYYPAQAVDALRWLRRPRAPAVESGAERGSTSASDPSLVGKAVRRLLPAAHGSIGTPISELSRFSKKRWDEHFVRAGWEILHYGNNGALASGDYLLGSLLPMSARRMLGRATGGIAHVYLLRPRRSA